MDKILSQKPKVFTPNLAINFETSECGERPVGWSSYVVHDWIFAFLSPKIHEVVQEHKRDGKPFSVIASYIKTN